jgi:hypothetical protein
MMGQQFVVLYVKLNLIHTELPLIKVYPASCSGITFHKIFVASIFTALQTCRINDRDFSKLSCIYHSTVREGT